MQLSHIQKIKEVCLNHAKNLLEASDLLAANKKYNLAYHMGTLALEEVGKFQLSMMTLAPRIHGIHEEDIPAFLEKHGEDHEQKLFWALWGPSLLRDRVSSEKIEELRGLSKTIHANRLRGLYTEISAESVQSPNDNISQEDLAPLLELAKVTIQAEEAVSLTEPSKEDTIIYNWFLGATGDRDKNKLIFGGPSINKLTELGSGFEWMRWLKTQFEDAGRESLQILNAELKREKPTGPDAFKPKWRFTVRLHTTTHTIRNKPLNWWNETVLAIKLLPVAKQKSAIDVQFDLPSGVHMAGVYNAGHFFFRNILIALNVGTMGQFLRAKIMDQTRFFDKLIDLDRHAKGELIAQDMRFVLTRNEGENETRPLSTDDLARVAKCWSFMAPIKEPKRIEPFARYHSAICLLAKTDIHTDFRLMVYQEFLAALELATSALPIDEGEADFSSWIGKLMTDLNLSPEQLTKHTKIIDSLRTKKDIPAEINFDDVWAMKTFVEFYFLKVTNKDMVEKLSRPTKKTQPS